MWGKTGSCKGRGSCSQDSLYEIRINKQREKREKSCQLRIHRHTDIHAHGLTCGTQGHRCSSCIFCYFQIYDDCHSLNESSSHRLIYLNSCSPVGGTVQDGWRCGLAIEDVSLAVGFEVSKTNQFSLCLTLWMTGKLPATAPAPCLPALCHTHYHTRHGL